MKIVQSSILFCLCFVILNCTNEETPITEPVTDEKSDSETEEPVVQPEPEMEVYFTLNINSSYESTPLNSEQIQNWIIIHDLEGNLIDYQSFEPGQQVVFKELPEDTPEKLTITLFNHHFRINEYRHDFETYPNIDKGKEWFLNTYGLNIGSSAESDNYNQTISDIPNPQGGIPYYSLSSDRNLVSLSSSSSSPELGKTNLELENIKLKKGEEYLLIVQGILNQAFYRYAFIKPMENANLPDLSFNDLTPVTLSAEFNFPPTSLKFFSARGFSAEKSYNDLGFKLVDGTSVKVNTEASNRFSVNIPIIETFDRFQTIVQMNLTEGYKWYYVKQGEYPNNTFIPEKPIVDYVNQEINDFVISTNLNYQRKISSWFVRSDNTDGSKSATLRKVNSTDTMYPILGQLPEEFNTLYPRMNLENITYLATDFYLRNESYSDFIFNKFESNKDRWNQDLELEIITLVKE